MMDWEAWRAAQTQDDDVVISLGERTNMWNTCGSFIGICPECRKSGATSGCGKYYICGQIVSEGDISNGDGVDHCCLIELKVADDGEKRDNH